MSLVVLQVEQVVVAATMVVAAPIMVVATTIVVATNTMVVFKGQFFLCFIMRGPFTSYFKINFSNFSSLYQNHSCYLPSILLCLGSCKFEYISFFLHIETFKSTVLFISHQE